MRQLVSYTEHLFAPDTGETAARRILADLLIGVHGLDERRKLLTTSNATSVQRFN
jgi:hypothetical protein